MNLLQFTYIKGKNIIVGLPYSGTLGATLYMTGKPGAKK